MKNHSKKYGLLPKSGMFLLCTALLMFTASCSTLNKMGSFITDSSSGSASNSIRKQRLSTSSRQRSNHSASEADIFNQKIFLLASEISANLKQYRPDVSSVVVSTFVDMNNLENTSEFGRFVTERLVHEMHRAGYKVYEIRQATNIVTKPSQGEFNITRHGSKLLNRYSSDAVVVGTYALVQGMLTLHIRMIDWKSSRVISVGSTAFNINEDSYANELLGLDNKQGVSLTMHEMEAVK